MPRHPRLRPAVIAKLHRTVRAYATIWVAVGLTGPVVLAQGLALNPPAAPGQPALPRLGADAPAGIQVLDRGPIHEAFAEPIVDPAARELDKMIVPREPPEPIKELPPDNRPDGANVLWIPGYWMWSTDQNDFIWVSGVWRSAPPGRRWIPGHWSPVDGGFVWSSGLWVDERAEQITYLPAPPASLDVGPNVPAPGPDFFWIPGCWVFQDNSYAWRAGYWFAGQNNWVWIPSYYSFTPRGYIYVAGYWDLPLVNRGFLYAPVCWNSPIYTQPTFVYQPTAVVNLSLLTVNLFVNPYRGHYYYGGFGPSLVNQGFYPWYAFHQRGHGCYDPLFAFHSWRDGHGSAAWVANVQHHYRQFDSWDRTGHGHGPGQGGAPGLAGGRRDLVLASANELRNHGVRTAMHEATATERNQIANHLQQWRGIEKQRIAAEQQLGPAGDHAPGAIVGGRPSDFLRGPATAGQGRLQGQQDRVFTRGGLKFDGGAAAALPNGIAGSSGPQQIHRGGLPNEVRGRNLVDPGRTHVARPAVSDPANNVANGQAVDHSPRSMPFLGTRTNDASGVPHLGGQGPATGDWASRRFGAPQVGQPLSGGNGSNPSSRGADVAAEIQARNAAAARWSMNGGRSTGPMPNNDGALPRQTMPQALPDQGQRQFGNGVLQGQANPGGWNRPWQPGGSNTVEHHGGVFGGVFGGGGFPAQTSPAPGANPVAPQQQSPGRGHWQMQMPQGGGNFSPRTGGDFGQRGINVQGMHGNFGGGGFVGPLRQNAPAAAPANIQAPMPAPSPQGGGGGHGGGHRLR